MNTWEIKNITTGRYINVGVWVCGQYDTLDNFISSSRVRIQSCVINAQSNDNLSMDAILSWYSLEKTSLTMLVIKNVLKLFRLIFNYGLPDFFGWYKNKTKVSTYNWFHSLITG